MCAGGTTGTVLLLSGFSGMQPRASLVQVGLRGAEVRELCHLSGLFTEGTAGAAGREHISPLLLLVNAGRRRGHMATLLQMFIFDMPLDAKLLKNIKRTKILRS